MRCLNALKAPINISIVQHVWKSQLVTNGDRRPIFVQ